MILRRSLFSCRLLQEMKGSTKTLDGRLLTAQMSILVIGEVKIAVGVSIKLPRCYDMLGR